MQNYEANDKICIFGFSRGAYTARALAGMIHKVGLLPRCNHQQVPFAYAMLYVTTRIDWNGHAEVDHEDDGVTGGIVPDASQDDSGYFLEADGDEEEA